MILSRFFKPKWQHPNPRTRKQALQALAAEDPVLAAVARQDSDPEVRAALARLAEPGLLRERAAQDADAGVREFAATRLREPLTGKAPDSPPLPAPWPRCRRWMPLRWSISLRRARSRNCGWQSWRGWRMMRCLGK